MTAAEHDSHPGFRSLLRGAGLRATPVRLEVMRLLDAARSPLNAQEIAERLPGKSADRVTVYRTLNSFVEAGLAHKLDPGDRIYRFSLLPTLEPGSEQGAPRGGAKGTAPGSEGSGRPGAPPPPAPEHPHLVCAQCGTVECLADAEIVLHSRVPAAGKLRNRFTIRQHEVMLHGTCEECALPPADAQSQSRIRPASPSSPSRRKK